MQHERQREAERLRRKTPSVPRDLTMQALMMSDCMLRKAGRIVGPAGIRSPLGAPSYRAVDVDDEKIAFALGHVKVVQSLACFTMRRVLALSIETRNCELVRTIRDVAVAMGLSKSAAHRLLKKALAEVALHLSKMEPVHT